MITPEKVHNTLAKHMLVDGFDLVLDLKKSKGSILFDSRNNKEYIDFFSFFASSPLGINHPKLDNPETVEMLGRIAVNNPTNSDLYTAEMADFVDTFANIAGDPDLPWYFFIAGGGLAVENAMKAAFDWKVQKNLAKGKGEKGSKIMHFRDAFHGRTGYTMSVTNTDPVKIKWFPKFDWPRIDNPMITFPLNEQNLAAVKTAEQKALDQIKKAIQENPDDIAGLLIEPIQAEGGDHHFRNEFFQALRNICDEEEIILIYDEVQTGMGLTGKMWAYQNTDVKPDIFTFGKKTQVCGLCASDRLNEVDSVFKVSSNSHYMQGEFNGYSL